MAALLVALAILSVVMLVALPTWRQQSQREKEAELIFRGEQYARAIALYQRKLAGTFPPSLDVLVEQKFLRKKYKDPITGDDFVPVYAGSTSLGEMLDSVDGAGRRAGAGSDPGAPRRSGAAGPGGAQARETPGGQTSTTPFGEVGPGGISGSPAGLQGATGIVGVVSKSSAQSIRMYNGRTRYDQWIFVYTAAGQRPQPQAPQPQAPQPGTPGR
jgi:type II secretory pathway pseudopilin PulG